MKKIVLSSLCGVVLSLQAAQASDGEWYIGLDGAYSILGQEKAKGSTLNLQNDFNDGWAIGGVIGYDFGQWRLEGEIGKHFHNSDRLNIVHDGSLGLGGAGNVDALSGQTRLTQYMVNAVYDFGGIAENKSFEPFIGGGLGVADLTLKNISTTTGSLGNDTDMVFAYQLFAGARVPLSDAFEMSVKYRYLATADASMLDRINNSYKASYDAHDIVLGVTYRFGRTARKAASDMPQPIKVAVAEPAPEPEVTAIIEEPIQAPDPFPEPAAGPVINKGPYIVHFDWDSSEISGNAQSIIETAVRESQKVKEIHITLSGHADRSGADHYNEALSAKRAAKVKAALINAGVEEANISAESFGERRGEIETADGIKEVKNRRVVIILE